MNSCVTLICKAVHAKSNTATKISWMLVFLIMSFSFSFTAQEFIDDDHRISEQLLKKYKVNSFSISGNKKTKETIITREMDFTYADSLNVNELDRKIKRSQQNLLNTSLFNFVTVNYVLDDLSNSVDIVVSVKERWYVWPNVILEIQDRNFNSWMQTKDFFRVNYGVFMTFENVRGRNETAVLKFRRGYTEQYGFSYRIPFINKKQTVGINFAYNFFRNNEIAYMTRGNQLKFYRNYNSYVRNEQEAKIGLNYRKNLYAKHIVDVMYKSSSVSDTINKLNDNYFINKRTSISYFSLSYLFKYDFRDSKPYPLKGYVYEASVVKDGFDLLKNEDIDNFVIGLDIKNYWQIMNRTYASTGVKLRYMTNNKPVYYFNRAFGFNEFVRGYEYYVVDGQSYAMVKGNINYQLVKPKVFKVPVKRLEKFSSIPYAFYLRAFADAGYVQDKFYYQENPLSNSLLVGAGIGLDFVTYYDYVLRVEFSVNRMYQKGIYLHFSAPL